VTAGGAASPGRAASAGLRDLGDRLRSHGLTARALEAWAGTASSALVSDYLRGRPRATQTPAAALFELLVRGTEIGPDQLRAPALVDALIAHGVVERAGDELHARVAVLPLDRALVVCDRRDAPVERDLVCWPDGSSEHVARSIPPGRRDAWIDLCSGSGFAPLTRPGQARQIAAIDLNDRAVAYARLGAALSGVAHLAISQGDVAAPAEPADLVTCNTPIPDPEPDASAPLWCLTEPGLFDRLWPALARAVRPGGMIIVHAVTEAIVPRLSRAAGERVVVTYTPEGVRDFSVAWWRPDAASRLIHVRRALSAGRPSITADDRDDALARG